ncbi:MAG: cysteine--tRNA ligase, partial [Oscillospiraceae bacterium]|nr:cysteine--tRNA ligase [Oscillospiraceae bacterium]
SAISMKHLGEDLDIHCGGIDNAFPHHTNEIAQSEAYLGHKWCSWWMHVLHLNTNSGKMSKSKGEFLTVSLLEEKGYDPLAYRLFCLQSHYRKSLVFSWENLDNAQGTYNKLIARVATLKPGDGEVDQTVFDQQKEKFRKAMGNDLNTSLGVTALYDALKVNANDATRLALLADFDQVLGLSLLEKAAAKRKADAKAQASASTSGGIVITGEGDPDIDALVLRRAEAKKAKDFAEADRIRDELKAQGIEVTDTKDGASWKRV